MKLFPTCFSLLLCAAGFATATPARAGDAAAPAPAPEWRPLFDGKTLQGWAITDFGGQGETVVEDGEMLVNMGESLSGAHCKKPLPKVNYEIELEAMKVAGSDFFCGLTFPYKDSAATFVVGGWGGSVVGISSINSSDASENETTQYRRFEPNKWHRIRVKVTEWKIEAWIDDEKMAGVDTKGKRIEMRIGPIELQAPMGLSTYQTKARFRNIRIRDLPAPAAK